MDSSEVRQKFEAFAKLEIGKYPSLYDLPDPFKIGPEDEYFEDAVAFALAAWRAGEIAQQEKAERNYARGFNHAVRDIVAALARQFNQELNEERRLGLHVALNTASGYHGFMDAEKSVPAAPEEKK